MDLTIGLTLGLGLAVALFATHRRERHVVEHYRNVDQKFYERWQAYCQLQRLIESEDQQTASECERTQESNPLGFLQEGGHSQ
jgi:hypothetical protein